MPQREFADQKALVAYAEQNNLAYEYEYTPAFAKWQRRLSPEQYEIAEVLTSRGVSRVMLFSKAIIEAEWEANAPLREAMAIKRQRVRALRAKRAAERLREGRRSQVGMIRIASFERIWRRRLDEGVFLRTDRGSTVRICGARDDCRTGSRAKSRTR